MGKYLKDREPLTEAEVMKYLDARVKAEIKHWGVNSYYAKQAMVRHNQLIAKYYGGEVIAVYNEDFGDFSDTLYSDGHVSTVYYEHLD